MMKCILFFILVLTLASFAEQEENTTNIWEPALDILTTYFHENRDDSQLYAYGDENRVSTLWVECMDSFDSHFTRHTTDQVVMLLANQGKVNPAFIPFVILLHYLNVLGENTQRLAEMELNEALYMDKITVCLRSMTLPSVS